MSFNTPWLIILGIVGWVMWTLSFWRIFRKGKLVMSKRYTVKKILTSRIVMFIIGSIGWGFLAFALMQPRMPLASIEGKSEVNDIFFVLDASGSMKAMDFKPNRMEVAKKRIIEFVNLKPRDRMGLVLFGTKAFTLMPLTNDLNLVKEMVKGVTAPVRGLGSGTNIGDALALAAGRAAQSNTKNKVIILLTDGEANAGTLNPLEAAEKVKEQKIKIYSIGIGSMEEAMMPVKDSYGRTHYQKLPGGSFDMEVLNKISEITGGKAFKANSDEALKKILKEINQLERTEIDTFGKVVYDEIYWRYLVIASLLLGFQFVYRRFVIKEAA